MKYEAWRSNTMYNNPYDDPAEFPEIYHTIQPVIKKTCMEMDDMAQGYPTQQLLDRMLAFAYENLIRSNFGRFDDEEDPLIKDFIPEQIPSHPPGVPGVPMIPGVPGGPIVPPAVFSANLLYDMVGIMLLSELLQKRGYPSL
jgi:hypothetical protein